MGYKIAPDKMAGKICWVISNCAMHCPILLKFGRLMHMGHVIKTDND